jgi:prevent-host-death family protein
MSESARIPVRELRNHVSEVLRRVENGEVLEVTVHGRPVAVLSPIGSRPQTMSTRQFLAGLRQADPSLRDELAAELTQTTDDIPDPWQT